MVTAVGKLMPLEIEARRDGNIRYTGRRAPTPSGGQAPEVEYVTQEGMFGADEPRYISRFATCPNAARHRRPA